MKDSNARIKVLDPQIRMELFNLRDCSIQVWTRKGGFLELGEVAKVQILSYGSDEDFLENMQFIKNGTEALGLKALVGPLGFSTYFDYRLKMNHWEDPPFPGEPANGEHEVFLFQKFGFSVLKKYASHEFPIDQKLKKKMRALSLIASSGKGFQEYKIQRLTEEHLLRYADELYKLSDEGFKSHFAYEPIGKDIFREEILLKIAPVICWRTSCLILDAKEKLIGYSLQLRDPRDERRLLVKTLAITEVGKIRTQIFFDMSEKIFEWASPYYDKLVFCLTAEGASIEKMAHFFSTKTTHYALMHLPLA